MEPAEKTRPQRVLSRKSTSESVADCQQFSVGNGGATWLSSLLSPHHGLRRVFSYCDPKRFDSTIGSYHSTDFAIVVISSRPNFRRCSAVGRAPSFRPIAIRVSINT